MGKTVSMLAALEDLFLCGVETVSASAVAPGGQHMN